MSDFSDSSHSGVVSPATSLIENFHKKTGSSSGAGSTLSSGANTPTPLINGVGSSNGIVGVGVGSNGTTLSAANLGRQNMINTSSSSSSSLKETSSTSQQVSYDESDR